MDVDQITVTPQKTQVEGVEFIESSTKSNESKQKSPEKKSKVSEPTVILPTEIAKPKQRLKKVMNSKSQDNGLDISAPVVIAPKQVKKNIRIKIISK